MQVIKKQTFVFTNKRNGTNLAYNYSFVFFNVKKFHHYCKWTINFNSVTALKSLFAFQ